MTINITPNQPPVIALTNVFNGSNTSHFFLVGTVITNQYGVSDDLGVTNVDFFVDGVLHLRKTNGFGQVLINDSLEGFHTLTVVASDRLGLTASSSVNVTVTNPPLSLIVTNGSVWKYENSSNDLGTVWRTRAYNDTGWTNSGLGDLGGGNINENNPERTVIDIGVSTRSPTIYFRRTFQVSGPLSFTNLILNLLRDDGATVYLNDTEIFGITQFPDDFRA